jgi:magnesium-transporting ATPase (P-type)
MTVVRGLVSGMQFRSSAQSDGARKEPQSPHGKESKDGVSKPTDGDMDGEVSKGQEKGLGALLEALKPEVRSLICEGIAINSTAFEKPSKNNPDTPSERSDSAVDNGPDERSRLLDSQPRKNQHTDQHMQERVFVGSQTEAALLRFTTQIPGCDYRDVRNRLGDNILVRLPFSSARKTMTTVVPVDRTDSAAQGDQGAPGAASKSGKCRVYVKGAAEMVLSECTRILGKDGSAVDLSDTERMNLERTITRFAKDALRAVCLAYKEMGVSELPDEDNKSAEDDEQSQDRRVETLHKDLVLLAILGIEDPLRPGVLESVRRCRNAGVFVRMVSCVLPVRIGMAHHWIVRLRVTIQTRRRLLQESLASRLVAGSSWKGK